MKRKAGEKFEFRGMMLRVEASGADCFGCFFFEQGIKCSNDEVSSLLGDCGSGLNDGSNVIFIQV